MAGPLVRSTEAPREGRVTGASTGLETELFVALQYQDDEAEVQVDEEEETFSFHMLREKLRVVRLSTSIHHAADWRCSSDMSLAKSSWDLLRNERRRNQELKEGQQPGYWTRRHGLPFRGPCAGGIFCRFESPGIQASL